MWLKRDLWHLLLIARGWWEKGGSRARSPSRENGEMNKDPQKPTCWNPCVLQKGEREVLQKGKGEQGCEGTHHLAPSPCLLGASMSHAKEFRTRLRTSDEVGKVGEVQHSQLNSS